MTELWIPVTIAAALVQCLRTIFQRQLLFHVPNTFVNFARYAFCAPAALVAMAVWFGFYPSELKPPPASFYGWCALVGVLQIIGTWALLAALSQGNFAVAVTLSKTEAIQAALLSILVLGEYIHSFGWLAICACLAGVVVVSPAFRLVITAGFASGWQPAGVFYGLLAGFFFGVTGTGIRAATLSLGDVHSLTSSLMVLATTAAIQVGIFGIYLCWTQFGELVRFFRLFLRPAFLIGMTSALTSFGYFVAMGLQQVAYVFALGQVEIIFSIAASRIIFKQPLMLRELLGIALIASGILMLVLSTLE
jgi:uncharacterized membrane protein